MGRKFDIPLFYRSRMISRVKAARAEADQRKRDFTPSLVDLGPVRFKIARHFGFCYGVENAIEIAYRALNENPDKRVFLLSEMIHNPHVNNDLLERGVRFILASDGAQLIPFDEIRPGDVVIVPAFGTTVELFERLTALGVDPQVYNATCPFVEKVWKRAKQLGDQGYTVVIHGKHYHEETRATFSHARLTAPSVVIRDMGEAELLAQYVRGRRPPGGFYDSFHGRYSQGFNPSKHLERIGVVNQTTMLAPETLAISRLLREATCERVGEKRLSHHFADTRDTLCYATSENQDATYGLVKEGGDIAIVVGGYNSSNTSHLVEICQEHLPTYYIKDAEEIVGPDEIRHLDIGSHEIRVTREWLPAKRPLDVLLTAGASCPDALVDQVLARVTTLFLYGGSAIEEQIEQAIERYRATLGSKENPFPVLA